MLCCELSFGASISAALSFKNSLFHHLHYIVKKTIQAEYVCLSLFHLRTRPLFTVVLKLGKARIFFCIPFNCIFLKEESLIHIGWLEAE